MDNILPMINEYCSNLNVCANTSVNWNKIDSESLIIGSTKIEDAKIILKDREIDLNSILTTKDLAQQKSLENIYKAIFKMLCETNKDEEDAYKALLKLYSFNYRYTVLAIENKKIKDEVKQLNEDFD